jgi:hypothetical protein
MELDKKMLLLLFGVQDPESPRAKEINASYDQKCFNFFLQACQDYVAKFPDKTDTKEKLAKMFSMEYSDQTDFRPLIESFKGDDSTKFIIDSYLDYVSTYNDLIVNTQLDVLMPEEIEALHNYIQGLKDKDLNLNVIMKKFRDLEEKIMKATNSGIPVVVNMGGNLSQPLPVSSQDVGAN